MNFDFDAWWKEMKPAECDEFKPYWLRNASDDALWSTEPIAVPNAEVTGA